ncbi:PREDICTED: uncharacterized protein LOC109350456 [Lupinus angustifolius]|uniref:uncharacterized protein LOC109350456 n=1 Tax=Lupinus angustifolius TaxID=3871 RepID=UPI00092F473D|nr:PREDICTED: uncharacterized protein LOC109350456 [Lupinus angustifolius]
MPIYMLSLFKTPKKVISKLTSLQRNFLWSNKTGVRGIPWVAWSDVCKPKKFGGLGIKDLSRFNDALLGNGNGENWWWRDLVKIGTNDDGSDWMEANLWKEIGDRFHTCFWKDILFGNRTLFPRLFLLALDKDALVVE